jgi:3',5'-cyclic-AMP phosphodiesterase
MTCSVARICYSAAMPIYLPAISRRNFLATTATAATAALVAPSLFAAERKTDADTWALLSDIHIAADPTKTARNTNMTDNLKTAREEILNWPSRPAGVLVNGDLAFNSGEVADYKAVAKILDPLRKDGMSIMLGMGNHDNRLRFWEALKSAKHTQPRLDDQQVTVVEGKHVNIYMLDSLIKTLHTPGVIGTEQREWLKKTLDANPNKPGIIMVHHNPVDNGLKVNLEDQKEVFDIIRPRKQVKAWIFGHTHQWNVAQDKSGIHLINLPPVAYLFTPGQPNGWTHATFKPDGLRVELRCIDKSHQKHGETHELKYRA